jgi:hypothetical protein
LEEHGNCISNILGGPMIIRLVPGFEPNENRKLSSAKLGMKVERKLSDFSAEKRKRNKNMKTKTEICETEMETEFFWRK